MHRRILLSHAMHMGVLGSVPDYVSLYPAHACMGGSPPRAHIYGWVQRLHGISCGSVWLKFTSIVVYSPVIRLSQSYTLNYVIIYVLNFMVKLTYIEVNFKNILLE